MPRGTGFVNFDAYLRANRPQAEALAGQLAGDVEKEGEAVKGTLTKAKRDLANAITANAAAYDPYTQYSGGLRPMLTPEQAEAIGGKTYSGPSGLMGVDELSRRAADVGRQAATAGSLAGRTAKLQGRGTGSTYSLGQATLDSALAGAASGDRLGNLRQLYGGLLGDVTKAASEGGQAATAARQNVEDVASKYRNYAARRRQELLDYGKAQERPQLGDPETMGSMVGKRGKINEKLGGGLEGGAEPEYAAPISRYVGIGSGEMAGYGKPQALPGTPQRSTGAEPTPQPRYVAPAMPSTTSALGMPAPTRIIEPDLSDEKMGKAAGKRKSKYDFVGNY